MNSDLWILYGIIAAIAAFGLAAIIVSSNMVRAEEKACLERGGTPVTVRTQVTCFAKEALK